jgi:APA family basic amino acid/polyamine antiporter
MAAAGLVRRLGLVDAASLVVGVVVGAGIFLTPGVVAGHVTSSAGIAGVWLATGLFTLSGALAFAELGALLPASGGQYAFLREAYGPLVAFLCGWAFLVVIWSGTLAALAVAFASHLSQLVPLGPKGEAVATAGTIAVLTAVNYRGLRPGAWVQNLLTAGKLALLAMLIGAAYWRGPEVSAGSSAGWSWRGLMLAVAACSWTYDGWQALSFVAGEIRQPAKNLPRALLGGLALVTLLYVAANAAFAPLLRAAPRSGSDSGILATATPLFGPAGQSWVAAAILLSIAGALNGGILTCSRIYFAQARDGLFFARFAQIHPRFGTPAFSLIFQGVWASVLALSGTFETLLTYTMFGNWIFTALAVAAVVVLRRKRPEQERPYRTWGYPVTPLLYCTLSAVLVAGSIAAQPLPSLAGAGLMLTGIPGYYLWLTIARRRPQQC